MASFEEIDKARRLLGLGEAADLKEIKAAYRKLAHRYHPDLRDGDKDSREAMRELNRAYELLQEYCRRYKYSFRAEAVARVYPDEAYLKWWRENWSV
jgi:DnaJ-class molecular chaperone